MRDIIIFDTEFTTWEGAMARNWSGPGEYRELVQIGALRFNLNSFTIEDEFEVLIKPKRNPVLSDYFIRLTSITQEMLAAGGMELCDGIAAFQQFARDDRWASYGGDSSILIENLQLQGLPIPPSWPQKKQDNIAPWFHTHAPQTRGVNSGRLAQVLGAGVVTHEHTGLADSRSIAAAIRHLVVNEGKSLPF